MIYDLVRIKELADSISKQIEAKDNEVVRLQEEFGVFKPLIKYKLYPTYLDPRSDLQRKEYEEIYKNNLKTEEHNKPIIEHNQKLGNKIIKTLLGCGLPQDKNVERRGKTVRVEAQWLQEFRSQLRLFTVCEYSFKDTWNNYEKARQQILDTKNSEVAVAEKKRNEKERETQIAIAVAYACYVLKLDPAVYNTINKIVEHIETMDKYFNLAIAMEETRGDWSEGFGRVEEALGSFKIENKVDRKIYDDINECCNGEERDGRIFRDCEWNYDKIYALANPELVELYIKLNMLKQI